VTPDRKTLLIPRIENGIVIDHIPAGMGVALLDIIRSDAGLSDVVTTLGLNYGSPTLGTKDMIKIWARELPTSVLAQISVVAPGVTIKRVTDYEVDKRYVLWPPKAIEGLARCRNPGCITNHEAGVVTRFGAIDADRKLFRCAYCERVFRIAELEISP